MYPLGGYVLVKSHIRYNYNTGHDITIPAHGPYKIVGYSQLYTSSRWYYELDGGSRFYLEDELEPASKEEALYFKMTSHLPPGVKP